MSCQRPIGVFAGIKAGENSIRSGNLACGSWTCPDCQVVKKKILFRRIFDGAIATEPFTPFGQKFLTLTYPGSTRRSGKHPAEIYAEMAEAFQKTIKMLRRKYGKFHYFRLVEPQRDGTPHFHVLLVGKSVAPKSFLQSVEHFWRNVYDMGFCKLNAVRFQDQLHAIRYMLKYVTKNIKKVGFKKRVFTASRSALSVTRKSSFRVCHVYQGPVDLQPNQKFDLPEVQYIQIGKKRGKIPYVQYKDIGRLIDPKAFENRMLTLIFNNIKKREQNYDPDFSHNHQNRE